MDRPPTRPTAEDVRAHLERRGSTGIWQLAAWLPLLAMLAVLLLSASITGDGFEPLLWGLLMVSLIVSVLRVRWVQRVEAKMARLQELSLLRRNNQALTLVWQLLPQVRSMPELHGRAVAFLAYNLDQVKAFDAAIVTYDYLIGKLPDLHPAAVQMRIQRAMALLASDQLTDADSELRRLRGMVDSFRGTIVAAGYRLAALFQQVRTNHFSDAYGERQGLLEDLRPLGIDAGYGHALMALCCKRVGAQADGQAARDAGTWWWRATLLLPPVALAERFGELAELSADPPAPWPQEATS